MGGGLRLLLTAGRPPQRGPRMEGRGEGALARKVYYLVHRYRYGKDDEHVEGKRIGMYSTRELAEEAADRYLPLLGFRDHPRECFQISEFVVDRDTAWTEGFSVPPHHVNPLPESVAWPD